LLWPGAAALLALLLPLLHFCCYPILCSQLAVSTLLKKGRQSFQELLGSCNAALAAASRQNSVHQQPQSVSRQQLKQALLVLIQHNCVRTYLQPAEVRVTGVWPALYLYEVDLVQILQVIRCACRQACRRACRLGLAGCLVQAVMWCMQFVRKSVTLAKQLLTALYLQQMLKH
jgi:hypothetical protein